MLSLGLSIKTHSLPFSTLFPSPPSTPISIPISQTPMSTNPQNESHPISIPISQTPMSTNPQNESHPISTEKTHFQPDPITLPLSSYPIPLSPPFPPISKQIELARALTASSRSSLFELSRVDVVFEDQWLLVVDKPSGVYCEAVLSAAHRLLQQSDDSVEPLEIHLANRLDRDTSGVMVITKSHKVASKLVKAFTDHKVQKTYLALSIGSPPKWDKIRLKSGHGRSKFGAWRVYAASDVGRTLPGGSSVRDMETLFEVLSVNGQACCKKEFECSKSEEKTIIVEEKSSIDDKEKNDEILLRAFPRSGRTHQIRLHCQYLGVSLKGDVKYEGVCEWKGGNCDGHTLHAESLSFEHPVTGVSVLFRAPLPSWASQSQTVQP